MAQSVLSGISILSVDFVQTVDTSRGAWYGKVACCLPTCSRRLAKNCMVMLMAAILAIYWRGVIGGYIADIVPQASSVVGAEPCSAISFRRYLSMWIVIVRFDFIPGAWCLAFTWCFWLDIAVLAPRARYSSLVFMFLLLTLARYVNLYCEFRLLRRVTFLQQLKKVTKKSRHYAWRPSAIAPALL